MTLRKKKLARRLFIKAVSAGIAAPIAMRMGSLAMAEPTQAPVRLFVYYLPHGWPIEHLDSVLDPLAPYAEQVTRVQGLAMNDGATNHAAIRAALTGFSEGGKSDSIDYLIASKLGTKAHVLGAMPYDTWFSSDSFLAKHGGSWVRATESPIEAASAMLASSSADSGEDDDAAAAQEREFRKLALGVTESELETMQTTLAGLTREQNKLSQHLESIRQLKANQDLTLVNACADTPARPALDAMQGRDALDPSNLRYTVDAHLELAAEAMMCGSARMITMQNLWANSTVTFGFEGGPQVDKRHHDPVSHSSTADGRLEYATCQRWFLQRLSEVMINSLNVPDPFDASSTVLDNSIIYVCSEVSDGMHHNSDSSEIWLDGKPYQSALPAVLIGGGGGYLGRQETVNVERNHLDLLVTLADAMGVPLSDVGGQSVSVIEELKS